MVDTRKPGDLFVSGQQTGGGDFMVRRQNADFSSRLICTVKDRALADLFAGAPAMRDALIEIGNITNNPKVRTIVRKALEIAEPQRKGGAA